jgi:hypothetical protein
MDISQWGMPSAAFPTNPRCNLTEFFTPQQLVIDITLCGDWYVPSSAYLHLERWLIIFVALGPVFLLFTVLNVAAWVRQVHVYVQRLCTKTQLFLTPRLLLFQYQDNVLGPGSPKYDDAYFEINYVRAYTTTGAGPQPTISATSLVVTPTVSAASATGTFTKSGGDSTDSDHPQPTSLEGSSHSSGIRSVTFNAGFGLLALSLTAVLDVF